MRPLFNDLDTARLRGAAKIAGRCTKIIRICNDLGRSKLSRFLPNRGIIRLVGCRSRVAGRVA